MDIINKYFPELTEKQMEQFGKLKGLYSHWNEQINVISRKDIDSLYEKHVLHSLSITKAYPLEDGIKVIDIGTGGGFPGIPLAIFYPNVHFLLVDSIGKKIKVVNEVIQALGLENAKGIHSRVENLLQHDFDLAVSRAVAPLNDLKNWAKIVLNPRGNQGLICLKGGDLKAEIKDSKLKVKSRPIKRFFKEDFFDTKMVVWAKI